MTRRLLTGLVAASLAIGASPLAATAQFNICPRNTGIGDLYINGSHAMEVSIYSTGWP